MPFLRAFFRALTDPETFDARRNPSVWLGALLAVPIPILLAFTKAPAWVEVLAFSAPVAWGALLGAAGRVATLARDEVRRLEDAAHHAQQTAHAATKRGDRLEAEQKAMTAELKLAQAVQRTLVPPDIVKPEVQVVVKQIPSSFVGGDYLQASMPRPDLLYLCIGDVSGHGVAAALVASRIHGVVRRLILEQKSPVQFLDELNKAALRILQHTYFFVTFAVFRVDLAARRIDYATAGHPAQLLLRADGTVEALSTPNRLLGMDADIFDPERATDATSFGPGDSLVLFTDGLFEIPGEHDGEILGEAGLQTMLENLGGLPPTLIAGDVLRELADFQGDSKFEDDVSLMVARFDPTPVAAGAPPAAARGATAASAATR
jgi:sigma-B regulation protein RsbU (phosphoserine phosphatase)